MRHLLRHDDPRDGTRGPSQKRRKLLDAEPGRGVSLHLEQHVARFDSRGLRGGLGEDRGDAGAAGLGEKEAAEAPSPAACARRRRKGRGALDDDSDASGRPRRGVSQLLDSLFGNNSKTRKVSFVPFQKQLFKFPQVEKKTKKKYIYIYPSLLTPASGLRSAARYASGPRYSVYLSPSDATRSLAAALAAEASLRAPPQALSAAGSRAAQAACEKALPGGG